MKKFLIISLCVVLFLAILAGCTAAEPEQPAATQAPEQAPTQTQADTDAPAVSVFKIGGMAPMTGGPAFLGENMKRLFEYKEKAINDAGGINGIPVEFIMEDDMGSAAGGTTAMKKLTSVDNVNAIIGPLFSSSLLAISPALNELEVPAITPTSSADGIFSENGYVFSLDIRPIYTTRFQCDYFNSKGFTKLAILGEYNDFTVIKLEQFNSECPKVDVSVVASETFQTGATDFRTELTKIKFAEPDVIFLNVNTPELIKIIVEMKGLGFDDSIFISTDFQAIQEDVFEQIGSEVDGRFSFTTANPPSYGSTKDLIDAYNEEYLPQFKAKYDADPTGETMLEWECINILIAAAKNAASFSGKDLRDALAATDMRTIVGNITFNSDGSVNRSPYMIEYIDGEQVYWSK